MTRMPITVFDGLKDARFSASDEVDDTACFLLVEIVGYEDDRAVVGKGKMEIELAGGHLLRVIGSYEPVALARLVRS